MNSIQVQLEPPYAHRRNIAECAIRTWNNHFMDGLSSLPNTFPMIYWDILIPQSVMTLNMMRQIKKTPGISAYEELEGPYTFKDHPMDPPGTKVALLESL